MKSIISDLLNSNRNSYFEHSYSQNLDINFFTYDRIVYYQQENLFTYKCPVPSIQDFLKPNLNLTKAYEVQEKQYYNYFNNTKAGSTLVSNFAKLFGIAMNLPSTLGSNYQNNMTLGQDSLQEQGLRANGTFNQGALIEYRDIVSLNMQLKSKSIIGILFLVALFIVLFRFSRKSEAMKQKLPKTLSLFWFFTTIQLYLDLNILQLDNKPYSKALFLGLSALDQSILYLPEILHLVLFLVCLFYFFSLVFRFNELFGHEEVEQLVEQLQQQLAREQRINLDPNQQQLLIENGRQQELGGFVSQSLIQVDGLTYKSSLEFYHLVVLFFVLFLTFVKLIMLHSGLLFIKITSLPVNTLDNLEMFTNSPRVLSLFTVSFLAFSQYVGRTGIDKSQYVFQKVVPFFIVLIHSTIILLKRRLIFTLDDMFIGIIFVTSLALYQTYESPSASMNGRFPQPFLHQEILKKQRLLHEEQEKLKNGNVSPSKYGKQLTKEDIKRRQMIIDQALKKREQEHEEYLKQKKLIQQKKQESMMYDDQLEVSGDFSDNPYGQNNEEFEEYSDTQVSNEILDQITKEEKNSNLYQGLTQEQAKAAHKKIQEMILEQLNQQLSEEAKKILQLSGGIDLANDQEMLQKLGLLASLKVQQQQNQQQQERQQVQQVQTTQGGQGQQSNLKQTAHKMPTKAPSGRPNQRKRR